MSCNSHRASVMSNYNADLRLYDEHLGIEAALADASICPTERQVCYMFAKYNEE